MTHDQATARREAADQAAPELLDACMAAYEAWDGCTGDKATRLHRLHAWSEAEVYYRINERDRRAVSGDMIGLAGRLGIPWAQLGVLAGGDDAHRALLSTARHGGVAVLSMSELEGYASNGGGSGPDSPGGIINMADEEGEWCDGYIAGYLSLVCSHECALPWSAYDAEVASATGAASEMTSHAIDYCDRLSDNRMAHADRAHAEKVAIL
jgi:hypothetical protein